MTLDDLILEIKDIHNDPSFHQAITSWLNQAVLELAAQYELPSLRLRVPGTLAVTTSNYLYNLSAMTHTTTGYVYMKSVFRVTSSTVEQGFWLEDDMTAIDDIDADHSDTGTSVQRVAVQGNQLMIYPKASENLSIWCYRKPIDMALGSSEPDGIPDAFRVRVLVPMVILKSFRLYPEIAEAVMGDGTKALLWWERRLREGLYGDGTQVGMIPFLNKAERMHTPRTRGPRMGSSLGGRW